MSYERRRMATKQEMIIIIEKCIGTKISEHDRVTSKNKLRFMFVPIRSANARK